MSRLLLAAGLAALSMIVSGAQAQTTVAPDPQRLALARQIFEAQGGAQNAGAAMRSMKAALLEQAKTPEARQRLTQVMDETIDNLLPRMFNDMASYYAADFTQDQLKDILAFYKSPTGQAMREKAPMIAQQLGQSMVKLMPKIQLSVLEKACAQVECTDQQRQQMTALEQQIPQNERF